MNPPQVVYPFVDVPGRTIGFTSIERTIFITSLVFSRLHYRKVTVVATNRWLHYLRSDCSFCRLITDFVAISEEAIKEYQREIFWSTIAKMIACQMHLDLHSDSPLLLMDADAIIFDPRRVLKWNRPQLIFAAGYREPDDWEAYLEGNDRMKGCLEHSLKTAMPQAERIDFTALPKPINAGCLYFNSQMLLSVYSSGLREFMGYFAENLQPRPYLIDPACPSGGVTYFSEVMVADQQFLAVVLDCFADDDFHDTDYFVDGFQSCVEFPPRSDDFIHFWKLKGWLEQNPAAAAVVEQWLLRRMLVEQSAHPVFMENLVRIVAKTIPMTHFSYLQLA